MRAAAVAAASLLALLAGGCGTVGPDFQRPAVAAPPAWSAAASAAVQDVASSAVDAPFDGTRWWTVFQDPLLDSLEADAAAQNIDLQTAALRIASARAQRSQAAGSALPQVAATGVAGRARMSQNGIGTALGGGGSGGGSGAGSGAGNGSGAAAASTAQPSTVNLFQAGFDATWELDLFGGVRRSVEAADAGIVAAEEAAHDAQASLAAEIARNYLALRSAEQRLAIVRADQSLQQRLAGLVDARQRAGLGSKAELAAQSVQVQGTLAQLPPLEQALAAARSRLALLLALPPGALDARLARPATAGAAAPPGAQPSAPSASSASSAPSAMTAASPRLPPEVPVGLPGDLLRRRPDVRRAEADLQAATARVGVARAKLFPSITLGLSAGLQSTMAGSLTDWASRFALGGALVSVPIFQGGQLRAQVELAGLDAQRSALAYRQAVLNAFHDADGALLAYGQEQRRSAALQRQLDDAWRGRTLTQARWQQGLAAYADVLDAERSVHQIQLQLAQSTAAAATDLVALFKALGGGWGS